MNYTATGGGPSQEVPLNPLEETVVELIQIREQVAPSGHGLGLENIPPEVDDEQMEYDSLVAASFTAAQPQVADREDCPTSSASRRNSSASKNRSKNNNLEAERLELLKMQAETQKLIIKKLDKIEKTVYKNYEINKRTLELKKQKFELYKKGAREAHELNALLIEVQKLKIAKMGGCVNNIDS